MKRDLFDIVRHIVLFFCFLLIYLSMTSFSPADFKEILKQRGFSDDDIEKNWEKYLEATLVITIDDYLNKMPEEDRKMVLGTDDVNSPEGIERIKVRFLDYYSKHKDTFDPPLNQLNFSSKIKEVGSE